MLVQVFNNDLDRAIRTFKHRISKAGLLRELKDRREAPGKRERRRVKDSRARARRATQASREKRAMRQGKG